MRKLIIIMGVSGSGKSTVGEKLSEKTGIPFFDGDDFHPQENIDKMASGQPLNDEDRLGWLKKLNQLAREQAAQNGAIIACSALKENYREILNKGLEDAVNWVVLQGSFELIRQRMQARRNHYFSASMLQSQFDALEVPAYGLHLNIDQDTSTLVGKIVDFYQLKVNN